MQAAALDATAAALQCPSNSGIVERTSDVVCRKTTRQKTTACAKQTASTCIQTKSTDETCKQHEINQAQTDLCDGSVGCDGGGAARSIQQWNSRENVGRGKNNPSEINRMRSANKCRLCKPTCQKATACAKQTAFTWNQTKSTDETCKQHEINQAQTDLGDGDGGGAAMRQLSVVQTNPSDDNSMRKATCIDMQNK